MKAFQGTGVAVITPFNQEGEVDIPSISMITEHLIQGGVDYLVVLGSTGEAATLNKEEKKQVLEHYFEAVNNRIPIVVGAGGNDTREVCEQASYFTQHFPKLSGVLSVSPYYNKPSQEGIYQHYCAVAASTSLPVILYNVPGRTGSNMTAETTLKLAFDCKNIIGIKEASGNMEQIMEILRHRSEGFRVISGDDALTYPMMAAGGDGVISVVAHIVPQEMSEMVRSILSRDFVTARTLHYKIWDWFSLAFSEGNPVSVKAILEEMGLCRDVVRLPLIAGSQGLKAKAAALLSREA